MKNYERRMIPMYVAPESKVLLALANVAATSAVTPDPDAPIETPEEEA